MNLFVIIEYKRLLQQIQNTEAIKRDQLPKMILKSINMPKADSDKLDRDIFKAYNGQRIIQNICMWTINQEL